MGENIPNIVSDTEHALLVWKVTVSQKLQELKLISFQSVNCVTDGKETNDTTQQMGAVNYWKKTNHEAGRCCPLLGDG